jgi:hypothetical protein
MSSSPYTSIFDCPNSGIHFDSLWTHAPLQAKEATPLRMFDWIQQLEAIFFYQSWGGQHMTIPLLHKNRNVRDPFGVIEKYPCYGGAWRQYFPHLDELGLLQDLSN